MAHQEDAHDHAPGHPHLHGNRFWFSPPTLERPKTFWDKVRQFFWGFMYYEWFHELQHEKAKYADIVNLVMYGDMIGIPLMNSTIGLRLLPYVLPELELWKHRQLEEHDLTEETPHIH